MNLYQRLGFLVLGSRLRRLSESFLSEITRAYQNEGIEFDASWFPVFYLLAKHGELSIKELSEQIEVSHPAASQLITTLKNKGLVMAKASNTDGRKQLITLNEKGRVLLEQIQPVWEAILLSMEELAGSQAECKYLLPAITALETAFQSTKLAEQISENLAKSLNPAAHD
jgi:DNA-binding MarR family transcriptional regulator